METLRFLMVTTFYPPYHLGGDAVHVQYLARALAARGHEVHVEFSPAAYGLKRKEHGTPQADGEDGVILHPIPGDRWGPPVAAHLLGQSASVRRFHAGLLDGVRPDIVHHHNISLLGLGVLERHGDSRALYTAHDYWVLCPRSDLFKYGRYPCDAPTCLRCAVISGRPPQLWRYGRAWRGFPEVDCAIAPSRFMARAIRTAMRCPVVHIPNFAPDSNPLPGSGDPREYFLFVGVLEKHKGVSELVAASDRRAFPIRIVGRGSLYDGLRHLAETRADGLRVEGWVPRDRLQELYRGARALIVPSLWPENAPLAAVEALSCGTPLLVSRRGGLEELLYDGAAGLSFEPDAEGILAAIDRFEEAGTTSAFREGARGAYERFHHPDAYLSKYLDVARGDTPNGGTAPGAVDGAAVHLGESS